MIIVDCEQLSDEWFQLRCGVPSASHFGEIITPTGGKSGQADKYMRRLAAEAVSGIPTETYQSAAMNRGIELEPEARAAYELIMDVEVQQVGLVYRTDLKTESASPDGVMLEKRKGFEVKCPLSHTHVEYLLKNKLPGIYKPQVQGGLWVCREKVDTWDFMSYYPGLRPLVITIEPDEKYIALMEEMIFEFNYNLKQLIKKIS